MCLFFHHVQVVRWSSGSSQEIPVKGRQSLQFKQSAGDAHVDQVFRVNSVQEETEAQMLRSQLRKAREEVGNTNESLETPQQKKINESFTFMFTSGNLRFW